MPNEFPNRPTFTPESLALSASLFTYSIESWIPKDFGMKRSEVSKREDLERALKPAGFDETDRLGMGHPFLDKPRGSGSGGIKGSGLGALGQRLAKAAKPNGDTADVMEPVQDNEPEEGDEEEESRSRSVGKSKQRAYPDLLLGRKKPSKRPDSRRRSNHDPAKAHHAASPSLDPTLDPPAAGISSAISDDTLDPPNVDYAADDKLQDGNAKGIQATPPPAASDKSGESPFSGPVALDSPQAKRILLNASVNESSTENDSRGQSLDTIESYREGGEGDDMPSHADGGKLNRTRMRREKRKLRRMAEKVAKEAEQRHTE